MGLNKIKINSQKFIFNYNENINLWNSIIYDI